MNKDRKKLLEEYKQMRIDAAMELCKSIPRSNRMSGLGEISSNTIIVHPECDDRYELYSIYENGITYKLKKNAIKLFYGLTNMSNGWNRDPVSLSPEVTPIEYLIENMEMNRPKHHSKLIV